MKLTESVEAKVVRVTNRERKQFHLVQPVTAHGDISSFDILELARWIRGTRGYDSCVVVSQDGKGGWLIQGADPEDLKEFEPYSKLDWWVENINRLQK